MTENNISEIIRKLSQSCVLPPSSNPVASATLANAIRAAPVKSTERSFSCNLAVAEGAL